MVPLISLDKLRPKIQNMLTKMGLNGLKPGSIHYLIKTNKTNIADMARCLNCLCGIKCTDLHCLPLVDGKRTGPVR